VNPQRLVVVYRLTERCNLRCGFCAYDRELPFARREARSEDVLSLGHALSSYQTSQTVSVHLSLLGGEPFLWPALSEVEPQLAGKLGLSLGITTNGTALLSALVRQRLLQHYDEITVSIDAPGVLHESLRGFHGGYERLRFALGRLLRERQQQKPRLRINVVLMRQTVPHFETLCRTLADWGIDEITFNQLGGADRPEFFAEHSLKLEQLAALNKVIPMLQQELAERGVLLRGGTQYLERIAETVQGRKLPVLDCGPGQTFLFVTEAGTVSPCSFTTPEYGVPSSTLRTARDIAELPARFHALRQQKRAAACNDCRSTHVFAKFAAPSSAPSTLVKEECYGT
jgi:MoaA/NifB/PqqE/SkfB family radical SAM enzyme